MAFFFATGLGKPRPWIVIAATAGTTAIVAQSTRHKAKRHGKPWRFSSPVSRHALAHPGRIDQ
uniref:hypothetical protein n=1 Tax=Burkholderia diffusa TaxID=488732 RepID=UPI001CC3A47D|nr:hypothetical protein [Burkholderia diffusa]